MANYAVLVLLKKRNINLNREDPGNCFLHPVASSQSSPSSLQAFVPSAAPPIGKQDQTLFRWDASLCFAEAWSPLVKAALQCFCSEACFPGL